MAERTREVIQVKAVCQHCLRVTHALWLDVDAAASRHDDLDPAETYEEDLRIAREMLNAAIREGQR